MYDIAEISGIEKYVSPEPTEGKSGVYDLFACNYQKITTGYNRISLGFDILVPEGKICHIFGCEYVMGHEHIDSIKPKRYDEAYVIQRSITGKFQMVVDMYNSGEPFMIYSGDKVANMIFCKIDSNTKLKTK